MRIVFDGSTEELAALLDAIRVGVVPQVMQSLPMAAPVRQAQHDNDDDDDDDDSDSDDDERDDQQAQRRLDEAIRAAPNHGEALLVVFRAYRGREIKAAVAFERVRAAREASIGGLDHALKMLTYAGKLTKAAKGTFILR